MFHFTPFWVGGDEGTIGVRHATLSVQDIGVLGRDTFGF